MIENKRNKIKNIFINTNKWSLSESPLRNHQIKTRPTPPRKKGNLVLEQLIQISRTTKKVFQESVTLKYLVWIYHHITRNLHFNNKSR